MKNLNKSTQKLISTIAVIFVLYLVMSIMQATGNLSSLMSGLLVPVCAYSLVAVALNLCVGYLGELSLGHAGFMCIGAFTSALFSKTFQGIIPDVPRFILALLIGTFFAALWRGTSSPPRVLGHTPSLYGCFLAATSTARMLNNAQAPAVISSGFTFCPEKYRSTAFKAFPASSSETFSAASRSSEKPSRKRLDCSFFIRVSPFIC